MFHPLVYKEAQKTLNSVCFGCGNKLEKISIAVGGPVPEVAASGRLEPLFCDGGDAQPADTQRLAPHLDGREAAEAEPARLQVSCMIVIIVFS